MVDVIKRRTTGVDDANDDGQVEMLWRTFLLRPSPPVLTTPPP